MCTIPSQEEMRAALEARQGKALQEKLSHSTVAVCGLGGLGSNIAFSLARAGIGKLILIDFDRVDISNLHRQQYKANQIGLLKTEALSANLKEVSPYTQIISYNTKITEKNFEQLLCDADIICEAFDSAEAKATLVNGVLEAMPDKFLIAASGMAGIGSANAIKTRKITNRFFLCGDEISGLSEKTSLVSSRVMLCAAHQAHTVIRILAGHNET